jgi:hypothetical protein
MNGYKRRAAWLKRIERKRRIDTTIRVGFPLLALIVGFLVLLLLA